MAKKVVATGKYMSMSEKRGAAVEINGNLKIFNGEHKCGFLTRLANWCCDVFDINAKNPTVEIRAESLSSYPNYKEIVINSD